MVRLEFNYIIWGLVQFLCLVPARGKFVFIPQSFSMGANIPSRICATLTYTQTKKIRPIFMVLYLLIQLSCINKK